MEDNDDNNGRELTSEQHDALKSVFETAIDNDLTHVIEMGVREELAQWLGDLEQADDSIIDWLEQKMIDEAEESGVTVERSGETIQVSTEHFHGEHPIEVDWDDKVFYGTGTYYHDTLDDHFGPIESDAPPTTKADDEMGDICYEIEGERQRSRAYGRGY